MKLAKETRVSEYGGSIYILAEHDSKDTEEKFFYLPIKSGSTVVLCVHGSTEPFTLITEVSLNGDRWYPIIGRSTYSHVAAREIEEDGSYVFDTTGWLMFSVKTTGSVAVIASVAASISPTLAVSPGVSEAGAIQVVSETPNQVVRIDDTSATVIYKGWAAAGSSESAAVWRIQRINLVNGVVYEMADGNQDYDNIWDDRASLDYL